jgi:hypothetical protein
MARDRLTALEVKRAHDKGEPVLLPDGAGLYLRKQSAHGTTWTLRYRFGGRDRWMALGSYPDMELAEARKAARAKRTLVDAGTLKGTVGKNLGRDAFARAPRTKPDPPHRAALGGRMQYRIE